ncbi:MAG: rod shape-determining protein [Clostridia bacterium]|nr:rod shape-determining protein [Clostridia bacterium]
MFETVIAADIGSENTRVASRSSISKNETRAAIDPDDSSRVLAVGNAGKKLLGASEVFPVRGGIADITLTALMLRRFALEITGRRSLIGMTAYIAQPAKASGIEKSALMEVGSEAGFRRVKLVDALVAGAEGAGVDIGTRSASMIVDIGRESLNTAVFANGGVIHESMSRVGSAMVDKHIMAYFAEEHHLLITSRTAEKLKRSLDKPMLQVGCRSSLTGLPTTKEVRSSVLREAAEFTVNSMCVEIASAINASPPDAAGDLVENGIVLIGGGANQYGLADTLEEKLHIPVCTAANADAAVILGMQQMMRGSAINKYAAAVNE